MALHFDFAKVDNWKTVTAHPDPNNTRDWNPVSASLVHLSMAIGLGTITKENVYEWEYRVKVFQLFEGPCIKYNYGKEMAYITVKDIEDHIGMVTNVSFEKRTSFLKRFLDEKYVMRLCNQELSASEVLKAFFVKQKEEQHGKEGPPLRIMDGQGQSVQGN